MSSTTFIWNKDNSVYGSFFSAFALLLRAVSQDSCLRPQRDSLQGKQKDSEMEVTFPYYWGKMSISLHILLVKIITLRKGNVH
jgi:hypothetical protein